MSISEPEKKASGISKKSSADAQNRKREKKERTMTTRIAHFGSPLPCIWSYWKAVILHFKVPLGTQFFLFSISVYTLCFKNRIYMLPLFIVSLFFSDFCTSILSFFFLFFLPIGFSHYHRHLSFVSLTISFLGVTCVNTGVLATFRDGINLSVWGKDAKCKHRPLHKKQGNNIRTKENKKKDAASLVEIRKEKS